MKKVPLAVLLSGFLFSLPIKAAIGYHQEDPSMARVVRLFDAEFTWLNEDDWKQHQEDLRTVGYQDFPAFKRFMEDEDYPPYNDWTYYILISYVCKIDGVNMCSTGHPDMMRLTRECLAAKIEKPEWQSAAYCLLYLSQKGNADDLPLLEKYAELPSKLDFAKESGWKVSESESARLRHECAKSFEDAIILLVDQRAAFSAFRGEHRPAGRLCLRPAETGPREIRRRDQPPARTGDDGRLVRCGRQTRLQCRSRQIRARHAGLPSTPARLHQRTRHDRAASTHQQRARKKRYSTYRGNARCSTTGAKAINCPARCRCRRGHLRCPPPVARPPKKKAVNIKNQHGVLLR